MGKDGGKKFKYGLADRIERSTETSVSNGSVGRRLRLHDIGAVHNIRQTLNNKKGFFSDIVFE
jgi:hypothetical protein